jgi:predicted nucleic acid-binding protein
MTFTVVYDANVLYPNTLRDLLIRIAQSGTVQAKWTNASLDEMTAALRRNRPDIPDARLDRLRDLMNTAVRDCLVLGYEPLIEGLKLPDLDDRHVLAAAIKAGAQVIVTRNLKDFPASDLEPWEIEAKSPDAFVLDQVGINVRAVAASVRQIADSRTNPPESVEDILSQLERDGLVESVAALRATRSGRSDRITGHDPSTSHSEDHQLRGLLQPHRQPWTCEDHARFRARYRPIRSHRIVGVPIPPPQAPFVKHEFRGQDDRVRYVRCDSRPRFAG